MHCIVTCVAYFNFPAHKMLLFWWWSGWVPTNHLHLLSLWLIGLWLLSIKFYNTSNSPMALLSRKVKFSKLYCSVFLWILQSLLELSILYATAQLETRISIDSSRYNQFRTLLFLVEVYVEESQIYYQYLYLSHHTSEGEAVCHDVVW